MKGRARWWILLRQEMVELWGGSKGLSVLLGYSVVLSLLAYLASADAGINLLDARESVGIVVRIAVATGTLAAMVISADAISGERERGTLEALLLAPISGRDLVVGKLVAATTMWVAALVVATPYVIVMADGPGLVFDAIAALLVAGGLTAAALTALGMSISSWARSNRTSLVGSVALLLLLAAPSQLPSVKANGTLNSVLVKANPVSAGLQLADNLLVKQQGWPQQWPYVLSPLIGATVLTALAVGMAGRLELGGSG